MWIKDSISEKKKKQQQQQQQRKKEGKGKRGRVHYQSPTLSHTLELTEYNLFKYHIMPSNYGRYLACDFAADIWGGGGGGGIFRLLRSDCQIREFILVSLSQNYSRINVVKAII